MRFSIFGTIGKNFFHAIGRQFILDEARCGKRGTGCPCQVSRKCGVYDVAVRSVLERRFVDTRRAFPSVLQCAGSEAASVSRLFPALAVPLWARAPR